MSRTRVGPVVSTAQRRLRSGPAPLLALLAVVYVVAPQNHTEGSGHVEPSADRAAQRSPDALAPDWIPARAGYAWSFPRDHRSHPGYKTEWWYFTGQVSTGGPDERRFAYQFTFFRVGVMPSKPDLQSDWSATDVIMGHAAIADLESGRHVFSETVYRATPLLGGFPGPGRPTIAWSRGPAGTEGQWDLAWNGSGFEFSARDDRQAIAFTLETRPMKPAVFHGIDGYSRKGAGPTAASLYYSFTRLGTSGTIVFGGDTLRVEGESWMDREFGSNQLGADQQGWDWFSLVLQDGRDVMLYRVRDRAGENPFDSGTLVGPDGSATALGPGDWSATASSYWVSPSTKARYPSGWVVQIPAASLELRVEPELPNQENRSERLEDLYYWEGAVAVFDAEGARIGRGFVELTGYGAGSRPAI